MIKNGFQYDPKHPNWRFLGGGSTKATKLPPQPDPIPTPEDINLEATKKGEAERRRLRGRFGRSSTILTESTLGTTTQAKSPILGVTGT